MRLTALTAVAAVSLTATPALAVLASPYQRAAEMTVAIEAAVGVLGIYAIESVRILDADRYQIDTLRCTVVVEIVDTAIPGEPVTLGRRQFAAVAGTPDCTD